MSARMNNQRSEEKLNVLIKKYLKKYGCCIQGRSDDIWDIRKSPLGDFGVFAIKDIQAGEIIFIDSPILLGPRCLPRQSQQCSNCYSVNDIKKCEKNCGLTICEQCTTGQNHMRECQLLIKLMQERRDTLEINEELTKCLTPLRALLLDEEDLEVLKNLKSHKGSQHGKEVDILTELKFELSTEQKDFLYFVCTVLDANAFEVLTNKGTSFSLKGLYPLGSLANHRCFPNVFYVFDGKHRMVTRASVFIPKNTEIFQTYTKLLWGTITRNYHLKQSKHFICKCDRCKDPSEFGSNLSAVTCRKCSGKLLPTNPQQPKKWQCETCMSIESAKDVGKILAMVGSFLKGISNDDFKLMFSFLTGKLATLMPDCNQVAVELKYKIIWILGHNTGFLLKELSWDLLLVKYQYCKDILSIMDTMGIGKCNMRGLLCCELYNCIEEMKSRKTNENFEEQSKIYLQEAIDILKYAARVPEIVKVAIERGIK